MLNADKVKDSGTITFYTWLKKQENISPYLECGNGKGKGIHFDKASARTQILSKFVAETGCFFYLLIPPDGPVQKDPLSLEKSVFYSKDLFYSASRFAANKKKAEEKKNKNPRDDRSSNSITGYFTSKKPRVSKNQSDSKPAESDSPGDSKIPARDRDVIDLCQSDDASAKSFINLCQTDSSDPSDPSASSSSADSKQVSKKSAADSKQVAKKNKSDPKQVSATASTPTGDAAILKHVTPSPEANAASSTNPVQGDIIDAPANASLSDLAQLFYSTHSPTEFPGEGAIRRFLESQKHFSVKANFEELRNYLIMGTHTATTNQTHTATTNQVPTPPAPCKNTNNKKPPAKKALNFDGILQGAAPSTAGNPTAKEVFKNAGGTAKEVFKSVFRNLVQGSVSSSENKQIGATHLILINKDLDVNPIMSNVSSMSSMAFISQPVSSLLARTASNLDDKSDLFPPLMPCNADGSQHYISKYLPGRVFDKNYTHCIHACTLGSALASGFYGKEHIDLVRFISETIPSAKEEENGAVLAEKFSTRNQFQCSTSTTGRTPIANLFSLPPTFCECQKSTSSRSPSSLFWSINNKPLPLTRSSLAGNLDTKLSTRSTSK